MTKTFSTVSDLNEKDEDLLVRMAMDGHREAFAELVERSRGRCMGIALRMLGNHENAEDEVQNAFYKAYTHFNTFHHDSQFCTWLIRIVINQCYMRLRRAQKIRFVGIETDDGDGEAYQRWEPVEPSNLEECVSLAQLCGLIQSELQKVPRLLRTPLELYMLEDLPLHEVARRLRTSVPAVKSRVYRGQCFLRDRMSRHLDGTRVCQPISRV